MAASTSSDLTLFASSSARPKDALADVASLPLSRAPKSLQGQILLAVSAATAEAPDKLAALLLKLTTVDFIHVMLASCPIGGLPEIRAAAAGVNSDEFTRAIKLWRAIRRIEACDTAHPEEQSALVFRAVGKRGGRGHDFTSDDAKRAAKAGLTEATGLLGSTSTWDFEILAQVHNNRFWLGLRLNRKPLAPQQPAKPLTVEATPPAAAVDIVDATDSPRQAKAAPPTTDTAAADASSSEPPLLSGFLAARMKALGLDGPRDARDAVAPLWEVPIEEQLARKHKEMSELAIRSLGCEDGLCEAIRSSNTTALRNTCELHIGRDRDGRVCCGFRLGVGSSKDGLAVGAPTNVPFVAEWMVAAAEEMRAAMEEDGSDKLPFTMLRLRGSLRTLEAVAVVTPTEPLPAGTPATHMESALGSRLVRAAARHGQRLTTVLARDAEGGCSRLLCGQGSGTIVEELESGLRLSISPLAFFQASTDAAEALFRTVVELATDGSQSFPSLAIDLCCGGGVLGLEVAKAADYTRGAAATRVIGIELNASSCTDAAANAAANGLHPPQYEVINAKVEDGLPQALSRRVAVAYGETATVILDPPRTGMAPSVCKAIRSSEGCTRVVYVSCNPHGHTLRHDYVVKGGSLAANLKVLCGPRGRGKPFRVSRVVPVDLFPHTPHCELCVLCVR